MRNNQKGLLLLVRHTQSQWNAEDRFSGTTDIELTGKGKRDARQLGTLINHIVINHVFVSELKRAKQTLAEMGFGSHPSVNARVQLNERSYGIYEGQNKQTVREDIGDEAYNMLHRSWDYMIEKGESLRDVYGRIVPFFVSEIQPLIEQSDNVLVVSHGNTLRALVKYLESIDEEEIAVLEVPFNEILIYRFEAGSELPVEKLSLQADIEQTHA